MSVEKVQRRTEITANIRDIESTIAHQPYHSKRVGVLMRPYGVQIVVNEVATYGSPVVVRVFGHLFRKNGTVGEMRAEATYETNGGKGYNRTLPIEFLIKPKPTKDDVAEQEWTKKHAARVERAWATT